MNAKRDEASIEDNDIQTVTEICTASLKRIAHLKKCRK